jgi:hypothetical protein
MVPLVLGPNEPKKLQVSLLFREMRGHFSAHFDPKIPNFDKPKEVLAILG